jgi:acetyltransferase
LNTRYLHRIFFPKTIAIFGEGQKESLLADIVIHNILSGGYQGRVCGVGTKTRLMGLSAYPDIEKIDGPVDLGILSAPPTFLLKAIQSFGKIKPAGLIIISEANESCTLQQELLASARSAGLRLIGPHSWGILNPMLNLHAGFANQKPFGGDLAVVSQSSAICATILDLSVSRKIGIGLTIGLGDTMDVDVADVIDYLTNNSRVKAILLHVESLKNLRRFMSAARAAARIKPIIVLKTDRHQDAFTILKPPGMHQLSEISIYDAVFKRAGIIRVETVEALFDCAELVSKKIRPKGNHLLIISDSKIPGTMALDALRDRGVSPAPLDNATIKDLDQCLAPGWNRCNPICTRSELTPELFEKVFSCALTVPEIDAILILLSPQFIADPDAFAAYLSVTVKRIKLPVFVSWMGGDRVASARKSLNDAGISTNETPERAIRAFMYLYTYELNQRLLQEIPFRSTDVSFDVPHAREIIETALGKQPPRLSLFESFEILRSYGFPVAPETHFADTENTPVCGKKERAVNTSDIRITMGSRIIPDFGPVLFLGPGGGIAKIYRDWAIGLPPLNHTLARHMLLSAPILIRYLEANRRDMESDLRRCEELVINLSHLVTDFPEIAAMDMDVVLTPKSQAAITGANIMVTSSSVPPPLHLMISPYPNQYEALATTKNGLDLLIRPLKPEDAHMLQSLWATFSSKTLYYRFSKQIREPSPELLISLTQIDYDREIALVAIHREDSGGKMLGVGRLYGAIGADIAEFSVVVGDPWQGLGIGAQLLSHLIFIAKDRKIKTIWGLIQRENRNMIELARNLNFTITGDPGDPQVEAMLTIIP